MNNKGSAKIILAIAVISIFVLGGATWYYDKTPFVPATNNRDDVLTPPANNVPAPTAKYKLYRNEKYGFELQYPSDWGEAKPISPNLPPGVLIHDVMFAFELEGKSVRGYTFEINLGINEKKQNLEEVYEELTKHMVKNETDVQIANIGSNRVIKFINNTPRTGEVAEDYILVLPDNNYILALGFGNEKPNDEISTQIISSVKFFQP